MMHCLSSLGHFARVFLSRQAGVFLPLHRYLLAPINNKSKNDFGALATLTSRGSVCSALTGCVCPQPVSGDASEPKPSCEYKMLSGSSSATSSCAVVLLHVLDDDGSLQQKKSLMMGA